ncbi:MAG: IS1 family transposase [Pyrinomonadaceae bacterium]|nr:IS1 family transposase [Pyrinomonadaceae bacterium]
MLSPMVNITLTCYHCGSANLVRNGLTRHHKQRYHGNDCGRSNREQPPPHGYPEAERATILAASDERSSLRGLTRTFGVSRNTVADWLKRNLPRSRS